MRVGELIGLRWCDIDLDEGNISVNHTLVYYNKGGCGGCSFAINTPKTKAGLRNIPMMDFVKEAFLLEKKNQEESGITCKASVDCYTDFIFINRFGDVQHQGTLNKAIRRIIRDCNDEVEKDFVSGLKAWIRIRIHAFPYALIILQLRILPLNICYSSP